jgi:hypothetical protein
MNQILTEFSPSPYFSILTTGHDNFLKYALKKSNRTSQSISLITSPLVLSKKGNEATLATPSQPCLIEGTYSHEFK